MVGGDGEGRGIILDSSFRIINTNSTSFEKLIQNSNLNFNSNLL